MHYIKHFNQVHVSQSKNLCFNSLERKFTEEH